MFVILQKYDFSSKSQLNLLLKVQDIWCLWYCKSTIFQANHNNLMVTLTYNKMFVILQKYDFSSKSQQKCCVAQQWTDVCDTAKVRFFKQITTLRELVLHIRWMFVILQKYDFSSKSQHVGQKTITYRDVCDTAKVRFFKQITTHGRRLWRNARCLWYCKSTIFQANHNRGCSKKNNQTDVCDTAKVRFFKQITTLHEQNSTASKMFVILQKYDFSSKSQLLQACAPPRSDVCDTAKVRFFKQITTQK